MRTSRAFLVAASLALVGVPEVKAQTFTGTYTFGTAGNVSSFTYNGDAITNLTVGAFDKVGVTTSSSSGNFRANAWSVDNPVGSLSGSLDAGKYFTFTLTAAEGYLIDMSSLSFGVGRSATGPRNFVWRSDLDAYAANLNDYTSTNAGVTLANGVILTPDANAGYTGNILNLASLDSVSSLTLRFYAYNSEAAGGTGGLQGNFSFSGEMVSAGPIILGNYWAPVAGGGGNGTWSSSSATWSETAAPASAGAASQATTGALVFGDAAGTVTVSGTVTVAEGLSFLTDGYTLTGGTVSLTGADATANAISVAAATSAIINSTLSATNGFTKTGAGTLTLGGTNTLGDVTVSEGGLVLVSSGALGNTAAGTTVAAGATLDLDGQAIGAEAIALSGVLSNGSLTTAASLAGAVTLTDTASISTTSGLTLTGGIAGSGSLTKDGAGVLTLSTANATHAAGTTISDGALLLDGITHASNISVASGATLRGSGIVSGSVTLASGATLRSVNASSATFTLGSLTANGGTIALDLADTLAINGLLTLGGNVSLTLSNLGASPVAGTYNLLTFATLSAGDFGITLDTSAPAGYSFSGVLDADSYSLTIALLARSLSWGGGNATWSVGGGNWTNDSTTAAATFENGDQVTFGSGISGGTVTVGEGVTFGAITVNTEDINLTFAGVGLAGAGNVALNGAGSIVTLNNANTFTGAVQVNAGKLIAANNAALGSTEGSTTVAAGAELSLEGGVTVTNEALSLAGTLSSGAGNNTFTGAITLTNNATLSAAADTSLTVSGAITGETRTLSVTGDGSTTLSGGVTAASLTKADAGTLTISAASTFTSGVTLNGGTLNLNHATALGAGTLTLNGGSLGNTSGDAVSVLNPVTVGANIGLGTSISTGSLNLGGPIELGGVERTFTVADSGASFGGPVSNGSLTKAGTGTLSVNGPLSVTAVTVNDGTLRLGGAASFGSATFAFGESATAAAKLQLNGKSVTLTSLAGNGTVENGGSANSTLTLNAGSDITLSAILVDGTGGGTLALTKRGIGSASMGSLNLGGGAGQDRSTYSGGTNLEEGSILATQSGALGTGLVVVAAGTSLLGSDGVAVANDLTIRSSGSVQNFNSLASGLPVGWTVRTGATASALGTAVTSTPQLLLNATDWGTGTGANTSGNFRNVASVGSGLASTASIADQAAATDRALAVRLVSSFGDPGAAFTYQFSTEGQQLQGLSLDLQMLSVQPRSNSWLVQVAAGASPTSWTTLATYADPSVFGSTTLTFAATDLSSISDQENAWFRVVTLGVSSGSGTRDTLGIDNFTLNFGGSAAVLGTEELGASVQYDGAISLLGRANLTSAAGSIVTFEGDISGTAGIEKTGAGKVVLNGVNSFSGASTLTAGTLELGSANALGTSTLTVTGGTLDIASQALGNTIVLNGGSITGAGALTANASLVIQSGTLELLALDTFGAAGLTLSGGTLDLRDLNPTNVITYVSGGFEGASNWTGSVAPSGSGDVTSQLAGLNGVGGGVLLSAGQSADLGGFSVNISSNGATLSGLSSYTGILTLASGTQSFAGLGDLGFALFVNSGATANFGSGGPICSTQTHFRSGAAILGSDYTGTVSILGENVSITGLNMTSTATLNVTTGNSITLTEVINNAITLNGGSIDGLNLIGGQLTLLSSLVANTTIGAFGGNSSVVLGDGGRLGGNAIILGNLSQQSGSILGPGNSPGTMQVQGDVTLAAGAIYEVEAIRIGSLGAPASAGTDYDTTTVFGDLILSGLSETQRYIIRLVSIDGDSNNVMAEDFLPEVDFDLVLFSVAGTIDLGGNTLSDLFIIETDFTGKSFLASDGLTPIDASRFSVSLFENNVILSYSAIPEPSTYGLILGGLALAGAAIRRRRKQPAQPA